MLPPAARTIPRADLDSIDDSSHDIIDAHAHAFPDAIAAHALSAVRDHGRWHKITNHHDGTLAGLLASMDRAKIHRAVLCSVATKPTQVEKITDWSVAIASDRIIPFASVHSDYTDENGQLQPFEERFERMVQWTMREKPDLPLAEARKETLAYMARMPAWRDNPKLKAR